MTIFNLVQPLDITKTMAKIPNPMGIDAKGRPKVISSAEAQLAIR